MKLWDKGISVDDKIEAFTVGEDRNWDMRLAPYDVLGTLAHIQMLEHIGLLETDELRKLQDELRNIYQLIASDSFEIEEGVEDIHSQIELLLTRKLGEIGKKVHSGRSRNDQVLVDLKLYFLEEIHQIVDLTEKLIEMLLQASEQHKDLLLPGYTHMQVAMPSSFGLWFAAFAESLVDDLWQLHAAFKMANQNPLGSAAGYGSSFPLNRKMTTQLLGFEELTYNVVYAQMGRGKTEKFLAYAISAIATTLNKLAVDVCLYVNQNYNFLQLPEELTTGSSIMPHKKNPDVFEILRGKTNQLQSLPATITNLLTNLPSGYHRDLQLLKEEIFPAITSLKTCMEITCYAIPRISVNTDILKDPRYQYIFSVDRVNQKVLEGTPFRTAYQQVASEIAEGTYHGSSQINHSHEGSMGNLSNQDIYKKLYTATSKFDFSKILDASRKLIG